MNHTHFLAHFVFLSLEALTKFRSLRSRCTFQFPRRTLTIAMKRHLFAYEFTNAYRYSPSRVRRKLKIQDIVKRYRHERSVPDFYVSLFTNICEVNCRDIFKVETWKVLRFSIYQCKIQRGGKCLYRGNTLLAYQGTCIAFEYSTTEKVLINSFHLRCIPNLEFKTVPHCTADVTLVSIIMKELGFTWLLKSIQL